MFLACSSVERRDGGVRARGRVLAVAFFRCHIRVRQGVRSPVTCKEVHPADESSDVIEIDHEGMQASR